MLFAIGWLRFLDRWLIRARRRIVSQGCFAPSRLSSASGVPNTTAERMKRFEFAHSSYSWATAAEQYTNLLHELR